MKLSPKHHDRAPRTVITTALITCTLACSASEVSFTAVTFNAGLTDLFVPLTEERAPLVADAIAGIEAEVVCLQEVWSPSHRALIREATQDRLPHVIELAPRQDTVFGVCNDDALAPLAACVAAACADPPDAGCILDNCSVEFDAQEGDCGICLASNLGSSLDAIRSACTGETGRYQYDGHYGVMLLSAEPFQAEDHLDLDGALNRQAVIYAQLERGPHVLCTHLTAVEDIPYPKDDGSWHGDQQRQVDALSRFIRETATNAPTLLMGDLNIGPDEQPERFQTFLDEGFAEPAGQGCTFCADNPLVSDGARSVAIDHVLVRGGDSTSSRVLDEPFTVADTPSALSDHYGVSARVTHPE